MKSLDSLFDDQNLLLIGGTGSLGNAVLDNLLSGKVGQPERIIVFSRDEAKQHNMRKRLDQEENELGKKVHFRIGDIRDIDSLTKVMMESPDVIINMSALKHIPPYEYLPEEAIKTNVQGVITLLRALRNSKCNPESVIQVSTDKACKPVNVYGMTKALAERIITSANLYSDQTSFFSVRYGNVLQSRGSMIPFFKKCMETGNPIPLTDERMTRFLMTLQDSCLLIFRSIKWKLPGTILIPQLDAVRVVDVISAMKKHYNRPDHKVVTIGIRPGEKIHEILISEEELPRTGLLGSDYLIRPQFTEVPGQDPHGFGKLSELEINGYTECKLNDEYSSQNSLLTEDECYKRLRSLHVFETDI